MKSVNEIKAIISKLHKQVEELENNGNRLLDRAKELSNNFTRKIMDNPNFNEWKELHEKADNEYIKAHELKKVITVWNYNLLHAKKAELLPVWISVMKEYQGKKIGDVREKEIREKLKNLGVSGYFSKYDYHAPEINLSYLDKNGFCSGCDYVKLSGNYQINFFDNDNKFVMPDLESFKFYGENNGYIENPKQYIKQLEKLAKKAKAAAGVYDKALHEYNAAAVPGFAQIETYHNDPNSVEKYFRINK